MAYTKSQALAKNASPSTPTPSKKSPKQRKRRAPPTTSEPPSKKPHKSARKRPSQKLDASRTRRSPPPKTIVYDKFSSTVAKEKFESLKKRRLLIEKGFIPLDNNSPIPTYITDVVEKHGWESFCKPPISPIIPLVKEFYANLVHEGDGLHSESIVRGQELILTPEVINSVCGFENSNSDEYNDMLVTPLQEHFDQALRVAAHKGAEWSVSSTGTRTIKFQMLTPEASVWLHFIKSRLIPTTHDSTVSANRMLMLYAILEGLSIDVGRVILEELVCCSRKKSGKLFFPSLITKPSSAFPAFPPQLLEPWPIPTAGDADPTSSDEAEE